MTDDVDDGGGGGVALFSRRDACPLWLLRALSPWLDQRDIGVLGVLALDAGCPGLLEFVQVTDEHHRQLAPRHLLHRAAASGSWRALAALLRDGHARGHWRRGSGLPRALVEATLTEVRDHRRRVAHVDAVEDESKTQIKTPTAPAGDHLEWILRHAVPRRFPDAVFEDAARDGNLEAVIVLHAMATAATGPRKTLGGLAAASSAGHARVVDWLVGHAAATTPTTFQVLTGLDDNDLGLILWRESSTSSSDRDMTLCAMTTRWGRLRDVVIPTREQHRRSYPLIDAAIEHGDLAAAKELHASPFGEHACTSAAMYRAAVDGRLDILEWLHATQPDVAWGDILGNAIRSQNLAMVKWIRQFHPTPVERYALINELRTSELCHWFLDEFFAQTQTDEDRAIVETFARQAEGLGLPDVITRVQTDYGIRLSPSRPGATVLRHPTRLLSTHKVAQEYLDEFGTDLTIVGPVIEAAVWQGNVEVVTFLAPRIETISFAMWGNLAVKPVEVLEVLTRHQPSAGGLDPEAFLLTCGPEHLDLMLARKYIRPDQCKFTHPALRVAQCCRLADDVCELNDIVQRSALVRHWSLSSSRLFRHRFVLAKHGIFSVFCPGCAVQWGELLILDGIKKVNYEGLFNDDVFDIILKRCRNGEVMLWYLAHEPRFISVAVCRWAIKFRKVQVFKRAFRYLALTELSKSCVVPIVRDAARYGDVGILEWVFDEYGPRIHERFDVQSLWQSIADIAGRFAQKQILEWISLHVVPKQLDGECC